MNRLIKRDEYKQYKDDLNWRDDGNDSPDGQNIENPSVRDFNLGYELNPYDLRYWAKTDKNMYKLAWKEVDPLSFTPEYLADKILKLWNQIDGTLQNTFEAFTLRYDNKLKQQIANIINSYGYEVYPILLIDAPIYASSQSYNKLLRVSKHLINTFGLNKLLNDIKYLNKKASNNKIDLLLDYYTRIFPEDYSLKLLKQLDVSKRNDFDTFTDLQISDIVLDEMEKLDSGCSESLNLKDGGTQGYDFTSDMRYDTTSPNMYEVTSRKRLKRKKKVIAKDNDISIPVDLVIDILSEVSHKISYLFNINLKKSPVPICTYIRQDISNIPDVESYESKVGLTNDINEIYQIWEIFLNDKTNVYVVIYADCITNNYTFFEYDNVQYKGFYATKQEAINEIKGYL